MNFPNFEKYTLYDESIVTIATNTSSPILTFKNQREMKTPMQEHIKWLKIERGRLESAGELGIAIHIGDCIKHAESMLEKEEEVMCEFADEFATECIKFNHEQTMSQEQFFNLTFKTKER